MSQLILSQLIRYSRWAFLLSLLAAIIAAGVSVSAQDEGAWSSPTNLSFSGAAVQPLMIADNSGLLHLFWQDAFAGFVYSRGDGQNWSLPQAVELPFGTRFYDPDLQPDRPVPLYTPVLRAGSDGRLHAFWLDGERALYHSQVPAGDVANFNDWTVRLQLAENALTLDALADPAGVIHLAYIRPVESNQFPAGVYYRQSRDGGTNWTSPVLLHQSPYFRSLSADNARVRLAVDGQGQVFVAWDNRLQARVMQAQSSDGGSSWQEVVEIDRRLAEDGLEAAPPGNVQLVVNGSEIHRFWQAGHEGQNCVQYHQWSADGGLTWQPRQPLFPAGAGGQAGGCPQSNHFLAGSDGRLLAFSVAEDGVYALAWNGSLWSPPQRQNGLDLFQDPETFYPVTLGCHQFAQVGDRLVVAGCDADDSGGKDIWLTDLPLAPLMEQLAPAEPPAWRPLEMVAGQPGAIADPVLVADGDGRQHAFWSQVEGEASAIYYAGWDGSRWSQPSPVLRSPEGSQAEQPAIIFDGGNRLMAVWSSGRNGQIYFSQVETNRAAVASDWSEPMALPGPRPAAGAPDVAMDRGGTIYVAYTIGLNEDRGIYLVQSADGGQSWSAAQPVFDAAAAGWEMAGRPHLAIDAQGRLHLIWSQASLPPDSRDLSLYYARSEDGGAGWSEPNIVGQTVSIWSRLLAVGERSLHLLWQETDGRLWHRFSQDSGLTWSQPARVAGLGEAVGPAALTVDGAGNPQLLQAGPGSTAGTSQVQAWTWSGDRWQADESLAPGKGTLAEIQALAAAVSPRGELAALMGGPAVESPGTVLFAAGRLLDLPAAAATPLPALTATPPPPATATPTPQPTPTPTVAFSTGSQNNPVLPGGSGPLSGAIIGIIPAGLIVLVALFVGIRLLRSRGPG
jgi:hypothetical protein